MRSPGESPDSANKAINANIQKHEDSARKASGGKEPRHASQIGQGALIEFGQALHTVTDRTSPAHTDSNGNPKVWEGIPTNPEQRKDTQEHVAEESTMSPEQEAETVSVAQDAFKTTFGTQAAQEATTDPKKK
jgi:hypothetical protein